VEVQPGRPVVQVLGEIALAVQFRLGDALQPECSALSTANVPCVVGIDNDITLTSTPDRARHQERHQ